MTMQRLGYISLILFAALVFSASDSLAISWNSNLDSALNEAQRSEKPVMIDFYTTWCHWCKELDYKTYSDSKVNELAGDFVCVKVDAEQDPKAASKYGVRGYPTIVFLNYDGSPNNRVAGYKDPEAFAGVMEAVLQNAKRPAGKAPQKKTDQGAIKKPAEAKAPGIKFDKEELERRIKRNIEKARNRNMELSGIIVGKEKKPIAIINDIFVKEGDMIEGGKVLKITKNTAEVAFKDKTIILKID